MEHIPSWEANISSTSKTSRILRRQKLHCCVHKIRYLAISWARRIQSAPWYPVTLRFHLCLGLLNGLLPSGFRQPHYTSKPMKLTSLPVRLRFLCLSLWRQNISLISICFYKSISGTGLFLQIDDTYDYDFYRSLLSYGACSLNRSTLVKVSCCVERS